jgi:adenylate cyclase
MPKAGPKPPVENTPKPMQGVLRAVLVADAAGYSRLMPEDPAGTIVSLNRHRARMRDIVRRNNGSEAGFPGDYLLALFAAASDALDSALEFLKQPDGPGGVPLHFRVGLHVGDVFEQSGDVLGVAVNIATRLQQSAPIGGIVMSQTFRQSLPGKLYLPIHDIGELRLKNIEEAVHAFEVRLPGAQQAAQKAETPRSEAKGDEAPAAIGEPGEARPRIYLRPFRALGKTERAGVFADGLTEELVTTLSVFSDVFRVVHSAGQNQTGEGYEIVGQVRNGDRLRITCQLIERATGNTLWADRFDFGNDASYDAQERIAVAVITALQIKLTDGETASLWSNRPTSLAAWEEFHRARMCEARYTSDSNNRSKAHFAKAMELDPDFVPAIVGLGFSYLDAVRLGWSHDQDQDLQKALHFAELALGKDGNDPYAIALLAYVERAQGKLEQSVATMARAVRIAPRNGELVAYYANMLWMQGHWSAAVSQNRRALDLTPQPSSWIQANLGLALLWDGQPAEAQRVFETVIKTDADYLRAYIGLTVALFRQGRVNEARKVYRELVVMDPGYEPERWIAQNLNFNPKDSEQFMSDLLAASR